MQISRRDFIHAGCAVAVASLVPDPVEAWIHGSAAANPNRVNINTLANTPTMWANLAKGFGFTVPPANSPNSTGYPTVVTTANINCNPALQVGLFPDYVISWIGTSNMQFAQAALIRSSQLSGTPTNGVVSGLAGQSGDVSGNFTILNKASPRVVFTFGAVLSGANGPSGAALSDSGVSNGQGGNYIKVWFKTGFTSNFSGSGSASTQILSLQDSPATNNGALVGQRNAIGIWNYVVVDGNSVYITSNPTTGAVSQFNAGSPWVSGGEVVTTPSNLACHILGSASGASSYSGFSSLVVCTTTNETAVLAGQINEPLLVAQYKTLMNSASAGVANKGIFRFMDVSGVQQSYESDFTNRLPLNAMCYNNTNYLPPTYATTSTNAAITNGGSDAYTCADATTSVWSGSAYIDGSIVQGIVDVANSTANPTLNVGSHGAKPIFDYATNPIVFRFSGPPASAGLTMQWTFSATWLNGGTPYVFSYITVSGDTGSVSALNANLQTALAADTTLAAGKIFFSNSAQVDAYPRTAQAGVLTITYTSGPAICTMTRIDPANLTSGTATFIYNQILGGWIYRPGGLVVSIPIEAIVELCNQVGAHCYYNWPVYTTGAYITAFTQFMADGTTGLSSGLRFMTEVGNEVWNFSLGCFAKVQYLGCGVGIQIGGEAPQWSWTALRTIQYASLSRSAWTGKGRAASDHYVLLQSRYSEAGFSGQNWENYSLQCQLLTTSNTVLNSFGGLGGGALGTNYSASPNRCADLVNGCGYAGYWFSDYLVATANDPGAGDITGSVSDNAVWLQAALDYANGNTATAFTEMTTLFSTRRGQATIVSGTYNNSTGKVVLTLAAPVNAGTAAPGDLLYTYNLTGTGAVSSLIGDGWTAVATTSGTTVSFNASAGLGTITITGGIVVDRTAGGQDPNTSAAWPNFAKIATHFESLLATYDNSASRISNGVNGIIANVHYEGGPQWSVGSNVNNGTNSVNDPTSPLANQMSGLGWNVSAYTLSGTNNATEMAQMVLNMIQGWKLDLAGLSPTNVGTPAGTNSYDNMIKTNYYQVIKTISASSGRENHGSQYGYQAVTWGLFPVSYLQGSQYGNFNAIKEWNTGS